MQAGTPVYSERKENKRRAMADIQYGPRRPGYYGAYRNMGDGRSKEALTEALARELAEKYNVSDLSRNAYSLLLCDLRNAGSITTQEFSTGYGGTLPRGITEPAGPFPLGENKADFIILLGEYVQYCDEFLKISARNDAERVHVQSLVSTYSRLYALFQQIRDAASKTN